MEVTKGYMPHNEPAQEECRERAQQAKETNESDRMIQLVRQLVSKFDEGKGTGPRSVDMK